MWVTLLLWFFQRLWPFIIGGVIVLVLISWWKGGCRKHDDKPVARTEFTITDVENGCMLSVAGKGFRLRESRRPTKSLRLDEIAVPAVNEVYGPESRDYLRSLCVDNKVYVQLTSGRRFSSDYVGVAYTPENKCINYYMIATGHAWCVECTHKDWIKAQKAAEKAKLGIWSVGYKPVKAQKVEDSSDVLPDSTDNAGLGRSGTASGN